MSKPILRKPMFPNNGEQTTALAAKQDDKGGNRGCDHHAQTGWDSWFTKRSNADLGVDVSVSAHPHIILSVEIDEADKVSGCVEVDMDREELIALMGELESALRFADAVADQYGGDDA
jgi:hypothetical protein